MKRDHRTYLIRLYKRKHMEKYLAQYLAYL